MPAAAPWIVAAVAAAGTTYQAVDANQQRQHAKGAAEAQKTQTDAQIKEAETLEAQRQKQIADSSASAQAVAGNLAASKLLARRRTLIGGSSTPDSTILSSPGEGAAPTVTKTLLGS